MGATGTLAARTHLNTNPEGADAVVKKRKDGWTPEARAKLSRSMKKSHAERVKRSVRRGYRTVNGKALHWTQTKGGKLKLVAAQRKRKQTKTRWTDEAKKKLVEVFSQGGNSVRHLAEMNGVSYGTLYHWIKRQQGGNSTEHVNKRNRNAIVRATVKHHPGKIASEEISKYEQEHVVFATGECTGFLKEYAIRHNIFVKSLTRWVGSILYRS